jgi:hypothetical protein
MRYRITVQVFDVVGIEADSSEAALAMLGQYQFASNID